MEALRDWTARRAGPGMTIEGKLADGSVQKLTGVKRIQSGTPHPVAVGRDGRRYQLA